VFFGRFIPEKLKKSISVCKSRKIYLAKFNFYFSRGTIFMVTNKTPRSFMVNNFYKVCVLLNLITSSAMRRERVLEFRLRINFPFAHKNSAKKKTSVAMNSFFPRPALVSTSHKENNVEILISANDTCSSNGCSARKSLHLKLQTYNASKLKILLF
jgi:hypothetical protein